MKKVDLIFIYRLDHLGFLMRFELKYSQVSSATYNSVRFPSIATSRRRIRKLDTILNEVGCAGNIFQDYGFQTFFPIVTMTQKVHE